MRKIFLFGLALTLTAALLCGAGYRDFTWGMSPADLKKQVPDLRQNDSNLSAVPIDELYAVGKQLWPGLIKFELHQAAQEFYPSAQKYDAYFSSKDGLVFYFVDERLVCVGVDFAGKNPYQELAQKYGHRSKFYFLRTNNYTYDGALWQDKGRVIFYSAYSRKLEYGNIYYFDPAWLNSLKALLSAPQTNTRVD